MNNSYTFNTARQIIAGRNSIDEVGPILKARGIGKVGILTDEGIVKAGIADELEKVLNASGIGFEVFPDVIPEPPLGSVKTISEKLRENRFDLLIGIGGGSSLDVTKLVSVMFTNSQPLENFLGIDKIEKRGTPTLLIPTTAGTGSEVTPNAIVTLQEEQRKAGIVSNHLLPDYAVLDPSLTVNLPPTSTAATGVDALIHSLESYIGKKANPISDTFALKGIELIFGAVRKAYSEGQNIAARELMLLGSMYGGMALASAGTAAVHALAYPIGARYGIPHGVANSMLLLPVLEFTFDSCLGRLADIADAMRLETGRLDGAEKARAVLDELKAMVSDLKIPNDLGSFGCKESHLDDLSDSASKVTRLLDNNPKEMTLQEIRRVYSRLLR